MTSYFERFFRIHPVKSRRGLQMLPGIISWNLILLPIWASLIFPVQLAYFILLFDVFFFFRSFSLVGTSYTASKRIKEAESMELSVAMNIYHPFIIDQLAINY